MIVGGVLFGAFAGFAYWFPKFTGFTLNERLGRYAFWNWIVGFLLAFIPLYILGFMGATRRLDNYDPSMGWQGLFIVAGVGVAIICVGVFFQLLQLGYSIWKRNDNRVGSDPWNGRSLEWSIASPPPEYNFAVIPTVTQRDEFWELKKKKHGSLLKPHYEAIWLPKNSGLGPIIGAFALAFGFGVIWHMWWLLVVGLVGVVVTLIIRLTSDETEKEMTAAEVAKHELKRGIV
jgi:cytochrome o ubiquinol oxidase subunit 1